MTQFVNRVKFEDARQALVLCVEDHRKKASSYKKEDLEKC